MERFSRCRVSHLFSRDYDQQCYPLHQCLAKDSSLGLIIPSLVLISVLWSHCYLYIFHIRWRSCRCFCVVSLRSQPPTTVEQSSSILPHKRKQTTHFWRHLYNVSTFCLQQSDFIILIYICISTSNQMLKTLIFFNSNRHGMGERALIKAISDEKKVKVGEKEWEREALVWAPEVF